MWRLFERSAWWIVYKQTATWPEFLLLEWQNARWVNEYVIPKWHIEEDETAKDAATREISEETWLEEDKLEIVKFITKINYSFIAGHKEWKPTVTKDVYLFIVKYSWDKEPCPREEERFIGFKWFKIDEIKTLNLKPDVYTLIRKNLYLIK